METSKLEGIAKDGPNYDVPWTIMPLWLEIYHWPCRLHWSPK